MSVDVRTDGGSFEAASLDLGVGGLFLITDRSVHVDERVALEFTLPDHIRPTSVEAEVRWIRGRDRQTPGAGLRFVKPSFGTTVAIHEFLRSRGAFDGT